MAAVATKDIEAFLDFLYGKTSGYVYSPTKVPGEFAKNFFKWPDQRPDLVRHIIANNQKNTYIAPALFRDGTSAQIENVLGSNVVWADFDGNSPSDSQLAKLGIPAPSLRVQSSVPGNEHLYWKFEQFETDLLTFQDLNRSIAYAADADSSGWDGNQVLRPVGSVNHKRKEPLTARVSKFSDRTYTAEEFSAVPKA